MIASRRRAHALVFFGMAPILPAVVAAAFVLRPEVPPTQPLDSHLANTAGFASPTHTRACDAPHYEQIEANGYRFKFALVRGVEGDSTLALCPESEILLPDLLVYWQPDIPESRDTSDVKHSALPNPGAILMGTLAGSSTRDLRVPSEASSGHPGELDSARPDGAFRGDVTIYSLAQQTVVASFSMRALGRPIDGGAR